VAALAISDIAISKTRGSANLRVSIGLTRPSQPNFDASSATGLIGQFFSGTWRPTIATGNIGTLPLSSPSSYTQSIAYSSIGDNYGFIAIGYFRPPTTGTYTFFTSSDDHSGVWIGDIASASSGRTVANATVNNGMDLGSGQSDTKRSGTISLTAGVWYPIRIVHEEGAGGDNLTFSWSGPGIAETTNLTQHFKPPVNELGQAISTYFVSSQTTTLASQASSQARERINFTTRLRERASAESNGRFNADNISSSGQLLVSNRLVAKSRGHATLGVSATVTNLHATARSSLRERLRFVNLRERINASSQARERINFTTRLRERASAESNGRFNADNISSSGQLLVSNTLVARSSGEIFRGGISSQSVINQLELTAVPSLRERVNFVTGFIRGADFEASAVDSLDIFGVSGLAGQFFDGTWRPVISTGDIGNLPLFSPTIFTSISYPTRGNNYGFIAIGYFRPPTTGTYTFFTSSDDGSGVWVGDLASATSGRTAANAVVNNNLGLSQPNTKRSGTISLTAGVWYPIRIVHEEGAGGDNLTFSWSGPGIAETTDLSLYFRTPARQGKRISALSLASNRINFTTSLRERLTASSRGKFNADDISSSGQLLVSNTLVAKSRGHASVSVESVILNLELTALSSGRERINWAQSISEAKDTITAQAISFARESIRFVSGQRLRASVTSSGTVSLEVASQALRLTLNAESNTVQTLDFTRNIENTLTARVNATARLRSSIGVEVLVINARTGGIARTGFNTTAGITSERLYAVSHGSALILVAPDLTFFIGWGVPI
jgi:PBP1b-binding outer membrane lipoprotein LpoB